MIKDFPVPFTPEFERMIRDKYETLTTDELYSCISIYYAENVSAPEPEYSSYKYAMSYAGCRCVMGVLSKMLAERGKKFEPSRFKGDYFDLKELYAREEKDEV